MKLISKCIMSTAHTCGEGLGLCCGGNRSNMFNYQLPFQTKETIRVSNLFVCLYFKNI